MKKSIVEVRETMTKYGSESVSFHELLQILIGKENQEAIDVIASYQVSTILSFSSKQFQDIPGIDKVIAERLYVSMQLVTKALLKQSSDVMFIRTPLDAANLFGYLKYKKQEHFCVAYLDTQDRVIGTRELFKGCLNSALVHPREVFKYALELSAASIVICHNHPSGSTIESSQDIEQTKRLVKAGELMGIEVRDHIIIGASGFCSFRDRGYIKKMRKTR